MPAKTPIYLKTSTPSRGKKFKIRDVLSGDMISPPLGDLRHSAHVGIDGEGDMFGDVEFLQGKLDMLPALTHSPNSHSQRTSRRMEELAYHRSHNSLHNSLLKTTFSMPVFIAPEQPPPKPPRLHLDEHSAPPQHPQHPQQRSMSVSEQGEGNHSDHTRGLSLSATIQILPHMVPSTSSLSEASSDESMSDSGGPLDPKRGLSLDSDTGLSNEDLRSEHCESPAFSASVSRSESLMVLDLDLGPSILEDVLGIMDRYKSVEERHEM